jgi:hypothetical protein
MNSKRQQIKVWPGPSERLCWMLAPLPPPRSDTRRGIGWLPRTLLAIALTGGIVALLVAVTSLAVSCGDESSRGCPDGSPDTALVAQGVLAVIGIPLVLAIGSALRKGRVRIASTFVVFAVANYVAWWLLLDLEAHGELTII